MQLCCRMQPRHCLSRRAEREAGMLAGEVRLQTKVGGMQHTNNLCYGGMGARNDGDAASPVPTRTREMKSTRHANLHQRRFDGETLKDRVTSTEMTTKTDRLLDWAYRNHRIRVVQDECINAEFDVNLDRYNCQ